MKTILDEIEEVGNTKKTYSRLSLLNSTISIGFIYFISKKTMQAFNGLKEVNPPTEVNLPTTIMYILLFFLLTGMIFTVLSFVKKEPSKWTKWISGILNVLFFVFTYSIMFYQWVH